jgi:hypothetical protein
VPRSLESQVGPTATGRARCSRNLISKIVVYFNRLTCRKSLLLTVDGALLPVVACCDMFHMRMCHMVVCLLATILRMLRRSLVCRTLNSHGNPSSEIAVSTCSRAFNWRFHNYLLWVFILSKAYINKVRDLIPRISISGLSISSLFKHLILI